MAFSFKLDTFQELSEYALKKARSLGATDSVVEFSEGFGQSVSVRLGEVETIEHSRDKSFDIKVYVGQRSGASSSSDFSLQAINAAVEKAVDIAKYTTEDPFAGLPEPELFCKRPRDLDLYHPWKLSTAKAIDKALAAEQAALDSSKKIRNSDGATVNSGCDQSFMANSRGFAAGYPSSSHSISVSPIARDKKSTNSPMHRDYWYSANRNAKLLDKPKLIGQIAAKRALSRLGARKISTRKCPVVFEPSLARRLIASYLRAVSGVAQYQESTFLLKALNEKVWAPHITIKEDPFIPAAYGSSPYDHEGVKVKSRILVSRGRVNGYLLSTYSGRKLGLPTTGNCGGAHNVVLSSSKTVEGGLEGLLKEMGTGLLVTEVMGHGVDPITGDYSQGAFGYWVENGVIVHPVEEITIAGNLKEMLGQIPAIGDDFSWQGSYWNSSLMFEMMTVAGS